MPKKLPNFAGQLSRNVSYNLVSSLHTYGKTIMFVAILQLQIMCLAQDRIPHCLVDMVPPNNTFVNVDCFRDCDSHDST